MDIGMILKYFNICSYVNTSVSGSQCWKSSCQRRVLLSFVQCKAAPVAWMHTVYTHHKLCIPILAKKGFFCLIQITFWLSWLCRWVFLVISLFMLIINPSIYSWFFYLIPVLIIWATVVTVIVEGSICKFKGKSGLDNYWDK